MQRDAADELDIEVAHAKRAPRSLAHRGEGLRDQLLERRASGESLTKLIGLGAQLVIGERLHCGFERIGLAHPGAIALEQALVAAAENTREKLQHGRRSLVGVARPALRPRRAGLKKARIVRGRPRRGKSNGPSGCRARERPRR
jgi:hypothetical protein